MASIITDEAVELFEGSASILVGTRDAALRSEATRGVGCIVHPDRARLTIFLPVDVSARALDNLRENGTLAVGFSNAFDAKTFQVKGKVEEIRPASEADHEVIRRYHAAYGEILFFVGIPRTITRRFNVWPAVAVTFTVTDVFLQTPGPNAGVRIGGAA